MTINHLINSDFQNIYQRIAINKGISSAAPLKLDWPVVAVGEALVAEGDPAGRARLVAGAGAVAAKVQPSRAHSVALSLASDVGVVAT